MTANRSPLSVLLTLLVTVVIGTDVRAQDFATRKPCLPSPVQRMDPRTRTILSTTRPVLDTFVISSDRHFRVQYSTTGIHAVAPTDANANGTPDYIDSVCHYLEHVYRVEVNDMGYRQPLRYVGDTTAWDVYVMDIGNEPGAVIDGAAMSGYYGLTYPVDGRPQTCDPQRLRTAAFLVLDNNYSVTDSVTEGSKRRRVYRDTGMLALKVTIAHEFHHMVQYAYASDIPSSMINEMTGVWMEHRLFPESTDYLQYMKPLFLSTDTRYWTDKDNARSAGYAHAFFFQFLQERGKDSLVRGMWELLGSCLRDKSGDIDALHALDSACVRSGTSLSREWTSCLPLLYATGYRADRVARPFSNATAMPLLVPFNNVACTFTEPSLSTSVGMARYQFRLLRCVLPPRQGRSTDTVDLLYSVTGSSIRSASVAFTVTNTPQTGFLPLGSTGYHYELKEQAGVTAWDTLFFSNGFALRSDAKPFPQPFLLKDGVPMWFPVPDAMADEMKVVLTVLTPDGVVLTSEERDVALDAASRSRVVSWSSLPQGLSSGVYVYVVESSSTRATGTFLVQP